MNKKYITGLQLVVTNDSGVGSACRCFLAACIAFLLSSSLLAACGGDSTGSSGGSVAGVDQTGDTGRQDMSADEEDGGDADAPPFNFAGSAMSTSMEEDLALLTDEEGEGSIVFADGRQAEITFYSCFDFVPQRATRGEVGLAFAGYGEMDDGQLFEVDVEHRDGANDITLSTTADPARIAANTYPVWSSSEVSAVASGLSLDLRDFWLLATVFLKGENGPEAISGPVRISEAAAEESGGTIETQAEADELFDEVAAVEADEGFAAKVEQLTATCFDGS